MDILHDLKEGTRKQGMFGEQQVARYGGNIVYV